MRRMQLPSRGGSGGDASAVARSPTRSVAVVGGDAVLVTASAGVAEWMRCGNGETAGRTSTLPLLQQSAVPLIVAARSQCELTSGMPPQRAIEAQTGTASRQARSCIAEASTRIRRRRPVIARTGYTPWGREGLPERVG